MLGEMPSVRAAAEKPPLSTTLTKVAMLVMRSMRSPDHAVKPTEMFRHFRLIKLAAITFAHIFGRRECGLPRDGRLAGTQVWRGQTKVYGARLCSPGQHFEGPSGYCGMLAACRIEAFSVPLRWGRARPRKPTHSTMMDPSSVGSAWSMIEPSPATPSVAS